jgi:alpha-methylacyl-CoA racemase
MGTLTGLRVVEMTGLGPAPFAAMMLADCGAQVLRIDRPSGPQRAGFRDLLGRGRQSVAIDLKKSAGIELGLRLIARADVLIEGFRPGVMERLGLGPEVCIAKNPQLIYGRMTGFGQQGPLANAAGHDINYIALAGALEPIGRDGEAPVPPLNLVGDFGGGGMLLAYGVLAALVERGRSGQGQVVDAAMVDGAALLSTMLWEHMHIGLWSRPRGGNVLDTGAPYYEVYETRDGKYVSVGAIEPAFYAELLRRLGLAHDARFELQNDMPRWPAQKEAWKALFREKTRAEWCEILEGSDACFAPVLAPREAVEHPHNRARQTFVTHDGAVQPAPAPRFSRTPSAVGCPSPMPGADTDAALGDWGVSEAELAALKGQGVL